MSAVDLVALVEKARAAGPRTFERDPDWVDGLNIDGKFVEIESPYVAEFIAAVSPHVVLNICNEVEELRNLNARYTALMRGMAKALRDADPAVAEWAHSVAEAAET